MKFFEKPFEREIFLKGGRETMTEIHGSTATEEACGLTTDDLLLCFSPQKGYFLAGQGLGTWCELDAFEIMGRYALLLHKTKEK